MAHVRHQRGVSERRACRVLGQARSTHRHPARVSADEPRLVERIIALATEYGRYGYRRMTGLLRGEGWRVNHQRVERLWRREGLKVPQKQPNRGRLWLTDGLCVRCRPAYRLHVWAYDFLTARTHDGRPLKILVVVDEYSRECLAIRVARRLRSTEVLETLAELFVTYGLPAHIRSDNGLIGGSCRGSYRDLIRPNRRLLVTASSAPSSKTRWSLVKRGGHDDSSTRGLEASFSGVSP